jgi:hypothetical protein
MNLTASSAFRILKFLGGGMKILHVLQKKTLYNRRLISRSDMDRARIQYLTALAALPGRMSEIYKQEMAVQDLKRQILETRLSLDRERAQAHPAFETASFA